MVVVQNEWNGHRHSSRERKEKIIYDPAIGTTVMDTELQDSVKSFKKASFYNHQVEEFRKERLTWFKLSKALKSILFPPEGIIPDSTDYVLIKNSEVLNANSTNNINNAADIPPNEWKLGTHYWFRVGDAMVDLQSNSIISAQQSEGNNKIQNQNSKKESSISIDVSPRANKKRKIEENSKFDGKNNDIGGCDYDHDYDHDYDYGEFDDTVCEICGDVNEYDRNAILLCDGCPKGYHQLCLKPKLINIPLQDWYCVHCEKKARDKARKHAKSVSVTKLGNGKNKNKNKNTTYRHPPPLPVNIEDIDTSENENKDGSTDAYVPVFANVNLAAVTQSRKFITPSSSYSSSSSSSASFSSRSVHHIGEQSNVLLEINQLRSDVVGLRSDIVGLKNTVDALVNAFKEVNK